MASSSSAGSVNSTLWPTLYCHCDRSYAIRVVWKSEANGGRYYYRCANAQRPCRTFIAWCDEFAQSTGFQALDVAPSSKDPVTTTLTAEVSRIIAELKSMQTNVMILNIVVVAVVVVLVVLVLKL